MDPAADPMGIDLDPGVHPHTPHILSPRNIRDGKKERDQQAETKTGDTVDEPVSDGKSEAHCEAPIIISFRISRSDTVFE
jgi:hypothetical protein